MNAVEVPDFVQQLVNALPAVAGGRPVRPAYLSSAVMLDATAAEQIDGLVHGQDLAQWYGGPHGRAFETAFAALFHNGSAAVALNSGTSALHCAYLAAGLQSGDEVIVPAACYVSAASAAVQVGAIPVVCDVDSETLSLDVDRLRGLITPRTKLIVPVHLWGISSDMPAIARVAESHGVQVVEDCAQSLGATVGGQHTGTYGTMAAFSFAVGKHVSTGHGGMVLCTAEIQADRVRRLAHKGKGKGWHEYVEMGFSYAMPEFEAIVGMSGLRGLHRDLEHRRRTAAIYCDALAQLDVSWIASKGGTVPAYYKFPIRLPARMLYCRDAILRALAAEFVAARPTHPSLTAIPWLTALADHRSHTPVAAAALPLVIELETGPGMTETDAWLTAAAFVRVYRYVQDRC